MILWRLIHWRAVRRMRRMSLEELRAYSRRKIT